jgi:hypothetical protein
VASVCIIGVQPCGCATTVRPNTNKIAHGYSGTRRCSRCSMSHKDHSPVIDSPRL